MIKRCLEATFELPRNKRNDLVTDIKKKKKNRTFPSITQHQHFFASYSVPVQATLSPGKYMSLSSKPSSCLGGLSSIPQKDQDLKPNKQIQQKMANTGTTIMLWYNTNVLKRSIYNIHSLMPKCAMK